jgi:hypothetical protein
MPDPDPTPAPAPDPAPAPAPAPAPPAPEPAPTGTVEEQLAKAEAEAEKWKSLSRKHEGQAKSNASAAKELEDLKAAQMTDTDKAVAEAEARGRQAATVETGQRLVAAEIKAALTGIVPDPAAIIEDLNLAKYVTDTGDVDEAAIKTLAEKYGSLAGKPPAADLGQGNRGPTNNGVQQLTRDQLGSLTPDQIVEAKAKGQLNDILGIKTKT